MDFFKQSFTAESLEGVLLQLISLLADPFQVVNKIRWHLKKQADLKKLKVGMQVR